MTTPPPPVSRALMAAVIGMGVLIVLGTAGLIGVVIHRAMVPATAHMTAAGSSVPALPAVASGGDAQGAPLFVYRGGGHVLSQAVRPDGSISLVLDTPAGQQVVIWNPEANRIVGRFSLAE